MLLMLMVTISLFLLILSRLYYLMFLKKNTTIKERVTPAKTFIVLGSGGHTAEMIKLLSGMTLKNFSPRIYIAANTDKMSEEKIKAFESSYNPDSGKESFEVRRISRARNVRQSWLSTPLTTAWSIIKTMLLVLRNQPDLILCNGPGTCIPVCIWGFLLKLLYVKETRIVYVESICRVKHLSLSGRLLYYFADVLVVQWPRLKEKYPRTTYLGKIM